MVEETDGCSMRVFSLISFFLWFCITAGAQIVVVPREKLDAVNNPRLSDYAGFFEFKTTIINAETMSEESGVQVFSYPFVNVGRDTLYISRLVTTCSCARASCEKMKLAPGENSEIMVRYNPKGHPGRFERRIFVYVGKEESPAAVLRLSVNVERGADLSGLYPVSMGNIRVRRSEIQITKGIKAEESCVFVNVSDKPLKLECERMLLPPCLNFRTEPEIVLPGEEGEIVVTYDPSRGDGKSRMTVMIKGLGVSPSQSSIVVMLNEK